MKAQITTLAAAILISTQAMAGGGVDRIKIVCTFANHPYFGVSIEADPLEGDLISASGPAQITLYGLRLNQQYQTTLTATPIYTRTLVGTSYQAKLGDSASIALQNITHVPRSFEEQLKFTGTLAQGEKETKLNCQKGQD